MTEEAQTKRNYRSRCSICGRYQSRQKPCNRDHELMMESYYERMANYSQAQDDQMDHYMLEQAGGLDEVQRQQRLRYYGEE